MGLGLVNCAFGCIAEMDIGQEKLVVYLPKIFHGPLVLLTGSIVQYLEINKFITVFKPGQYLVVRE